MLDLDEEVDGPDVEVDVTDKEDTDKEDTFLSDDIGFCRLPTVSDATWRLQASNSAPGVNKPASSRYRLGETVNNCYPVVDTRLS